MLIEFSVENFKCFAEKQTLDMRPDPDITSLDENLIRTGLMDEAGDELVLLPSVAIYGANASGKSSLVEALYFYMYPLKLLRQTIQELKEPNARLKNGIKSYFNTTKPICFNSVEIYNIHKEIFLPPDQNVIEYKLKDVVSISINSIENRAHYKTLPYSDKGWLEYQNKGYIENPPPKNTYRNHHGRRLFFLNEILDSLKADDKGLIEETKYKQHPLIQLLLEEEKKLKILNLLRKADFNIESISINSLQYDSERTQYALQFIHTGQSEVLYFNDQSEGTKKFLLIMPTIVHVLETGAVLLADELEAHLHPDLCRAIIELFNNPETNPKGSQLIFTTHNQDFMAPNLMRPDQIYFVNKDQATGASELYRASDFEEFDWNSETLTVRKAYHYGLLGSSPRVKRLTGE
jgi:AAA15 family ATPase/GTPase